MKQQDIEQHLAVHAGGKKSLIEYSRPLWMQGADPSRPLRLEVTTDLRQPGGTGMPEGPEVVELDNLEHLLNGLVARRGSGVLCMRVSGSATRVYVFYLKAASGLFRKKAAREKLEPELARIGDKVGRELRVAWFDDPGWTRLLGVFSAYDPEQWLADRALLMHMVKAGDAVHARRSVAHRVYFTEREPCRDFLRDARRLKLKSDVGPKPTTDDRLLVRVERLEPTLATWHLHPVVLNVKALAQKYGGTYDGWEAEFIQTLIPPPLKGPMVK
jgi:hypothetical protein